MKQNSKTALVTILSIFTFSAGVLLSDTEKVQHRSDFISGELELNDESFPLFFEIKESGAGLLYQNSIEEQSALDFIYETNRAELLGKIRTKSPIPLQKRLMARFYVELLPISGSIQNFDTSDPSIEEKVFSFD
jgi:hypothetical protein